MKTRFYSGISFACLAITMAPMAQATDLSYQKLTGLGIGSVPHSIACSDKWVLAGAPYASDVAALQGSVQVFAATTGAKVRTLRPPPPGGTNLVFGSSCAVSGNLALIGQPGATPTVAGKAYLFDLTTGKLLLTLSPPPVDNIAGNRFGCAVALQGNRLVVGAESLVNNVGAAYVFDRVTGALISKLLPGGVTTNAFVGGSLAIEGNVLIVGAKGVDAARGAAYAYDFTTLNLIKKLQPTASVANDGCGSSVAMTQGKVVLGAPGLGGANGKVFSVNIVDGAEQTLAASDGGGNLGKSISASQGMVIACAPSHGNDAGAAYCFDLSSASTNELLRLDQPENLQGFATATALYGNVACIAGALEMVQSEHSGAVYMIKPITRPLPLTRVAAKGEYAPGAVDTTFNTIGDAFISPAGDVGFISTLSGAGSNAGKDSALFSTLGASNSFLAREIGTRDNSLGIGGTVSSLTKLVWARPDRYVFQCSALGIASIIGQSDGAMVSAQANTMPNPWGWSVSFPTMVQCRGVDGMAYSYNLKIGALGVTASSDSGVSRTALGGPGFVDLHEGQPAMGTGVSYGQFTTRVAAFYDRVVCSGALTSSATDNAAVFQALIGATPQIVARKGDAAMSAGGAKFSAFIGESSDLFDTVLFKATLGALATTANNEGLWTRMTGGTQALVMRKGDAVPGLTGVKIAKLINFWQTATQSMALVQLSGTGVTAANDQALLLYQFFPPFAGVTIVLVREGDLAPGCAPATIGVISRVEVEPLYGEYLVLATLAGAPVGTELALFRGFSLLNTSSVNEQTLRRPFLVLRKGQLFNNQPSKLKSISLPTSTVSASGAGCVGLGSCIQEQSNLGMATNIVIAIDYENGVRQLVKGIP